MGGSLVENLPDFWEWWEGILTIRHPALLRCEVPKALATKVAAHPPELPASPGSLDSLSSDECRVLIHRLDGPGQVFLELRGPGKTEILGPFDPAGRDL